MVPDEVHSRPVYRKLIPRSGEELEKLNKEIERLRKEALKESIVNGEESE